MKGARVMGVGTLLANVTLLILSIMQFTQFICSHDHTALFAVTQLQLVSSICIGYGIRLLRHTKQTANRRYYVTLIS